MANLQANGGFQLRSNMDFARLRTRLRLEHGPIVHSDAEKSAPALIDVDKDIKDCNTEICRLQRRIVLIQKQCHRLEEYKACLRSLGSSIRKLPNETLLRIFDLACDMNEITSKNVKTMPVLAISGVCSRWRDLARSAPELWARLRIEMQTSPSTHRNFPVLELFLSSSQNSPLTLEITKGSGDTNDVLPHQLVVCNILATHSDRWKVLMGFGDQQFHREIYSDLISEEPRFYPALEVFMFPDNAFTNLDRLQNAPRLSRLSCSGLFGLKALAQSKFPWKQLTHLTSASYEEGTDNILQMCDNLAFLQLKDEVRDLHSTPPTTIRTLKTLSLELYKSSCAQSSLEVALSSMICPSLTSLIIEGRNASARSWPKESLDAFISRSSFHLTTLSMKFIPLSDANLIDLLYCVPSLNHLTIDDTKSTSTSHTPSPITPNLFQSLHAFPCSSLTARSSALVPKLQSLDMTCAGSVFDDEGFMDMVSSRWLDDSGGYGLFSIAHTLSSDIGIACLRSVVLRFRNRGLDAKKYKPMEYLEKVGMRVILLGRV